MVKETAYYYYTLLEQHIANKPIFFGKKQYRIRAKYLNRLIEKNLKKVSTNGNKI